MFSYLHSSKGGDVGNGKDGTPAQAAADNSGPNVTVRENYQPKIPAEEENMGKTLLEEGHPILPPWMQRKRES